MSDSRNIVVTAYGHEYKIDKLSISIFYDNSSYSYEGNNATTYCDKINSLELKKGSWVVAKVVYENALFDLEPFFPFTFEDVILNLDNIAIQKVLREIDSKDLAVALINADKDVEGKIFANMSSRASQMLKEEMERLGRVDSQAVRKNRDTMLQIVYHLVDTGEIIIGEDKEGQNEQ